MLRRVPATIDGLDTLAVAASNGLGAPAPARSTRRRRGVDRLPRAGRPPVAGVVLRRRPGRDPAHALQGQDRRHRRDGTGAARHASGVVSRRHDGGPGDPRDRDRHAAARCAAARGRGGRRPRDRDRARAARAAARRSCCDRGRGSWSRSPPASRMRSRRSCCSTRDWIVPVVAPLAGLAVGLVGTLLVHWLTATLERARTRDVFARFVPDTVVDQVLTRASRRATRGWAASGWTRPSSSAICAASPRSPRRATPSR